MNILAIESSSRILSVAVAKGEGVCFELESSEEFKCEHIIGLIKKALKKAKLALSDLDYVAVGLGPGSFTGLRIGIASAKGLSLALGIKIIGIGSLDIIASGINSLDSDICTILDAKRNNLYAAIFRRKTRESILVAKKLKYSLLNIQQLLGNIRNKTLFVGDGLKFFKDIIIDEKDEFCFFAPEDKWYPKAGILAKMALELIKERKVNKDKREILPIYLYPKDCQVRNEKNKRRNNNPL